MLEGYEIYRCKDPLPLVNTPGNTLWERTKEFLEKHERKAFTTAIILIAGEGFYIFQSIGAILAEYIYKNPLPLMRFFPH